MLRRWAVLVCSAALILAGDVLPAAAVSFDFTNCATITSPGSCPNATGTSTLTYTVSGFPLTVNGFGGLGPGAPPNNLFIKTPGGGENGIGLVTGQSDNEIQTNTFIELDTRKLPAGSSGTLRIGSVQMDESFQVCLSDTSGTFGHANCTPVTAGPFPPNDISAVNGVPFNLSGNPFVDITASSGDVLLLDADVNPAPEPSTLALLVTGAAGLVVARKRKKGNGFSSST